MFDPKVFQKDFPILNRQVNGKKLVYLDNAATTQKPASVIKALTNYYENFNANIHRGVHTLAEEATAAYEGVREHVAKFINAKESAEIIFTKNTTEAINLVAFSFGEKFIKERDNVVISAMEHHANFVPWQQICIKKGAELRVIPLTTDFELDLSHLDKFIDKKTKLVAVTQMSNVLGTIVPVKKIIEFAHKIGVPVLVDGAQSVPHSAIDVQTMDCDFLVFSAHKMLGPTGVGVLYGKREMLEKMPPFLFGGDMIAEVKREQTTWNELPYKFEAGTPNIADVIAFEEALKYLEKVGMENILIHDKKLLKYAKDKLSKLPGITFYGTSNLENAGGVLTFNLPGIHAHDVGSLVDRDGVAIRVGKHCAHPLINTMGIPAAARMSFYFYNTEEDIDKAFDSLKKIKDGSLQ